MSPELRTHRGNAGGHNLAGSDVLDNPAMLFFQQLLQFVIVEVGQLQFILIRSLDRVNDGTPHVDRGLDSSPFPLFCLDMKDDTIMLDVRVETHHHGFGASTLELLLDHSQIGTDVSGFRNHWQEKT